MITYIVPLQIFLQNNESQRKEKKEGYSGSEYISRLCSSVVSVPTRIGCLGVYRLGPKTAKISWNPGLATWLTFARDIGPASAAQIDCCPENIEWRSGLLWLLHRLLRFNTLNFLLGCLRLLHGVTSGPACTSMSCSSAALCWSSPESSGNRIPVHLSRKFLRPFSYQVECLHLSSG